ncbi:hypothetical protein MTR_2g058890 [Medicago truncatula]|uniref:Uncharacterized protein n=1 Tax=Medicago truncatula TaxID=3880 RepID=G7ISZ0_MEDTR|nr:hypothetical protein MTR_2g058890 [Medicago truncatula]
MMIGNGYRCRGEASFAVERKAESHIFRQIKKDSEISILLGRPFLATASVVINVKYGKIVFHVGDEKVEFEIVKLMKGPSIFDSCCMIDVIDHRVKECFLQKKGDLELIRPTNMKIRCKNMKPTNQKAWHSPCLQWHGRATTIDFLLLLRQAACLIYF